MPLEPGTRLGRYEIRSPIGSGGMGEVYEGLDTLLQRAVAIKVLPAGLAHDRDRLARFVREARALAKLSHPHLLQIWDFGAEGELQFAVTELLEGETLRSALDDRGSFEPGRVATLGAALAEGLAAAHARGVVHRDLKPENVFLVGDTVKILDFGLARLTDRAEPRVAGDSEPTEVQTRPGTILGTVGYMSPEQVRGRPGEPRSDLFALGAILQEMLTGRRAFRRTTAVETLTAILREPPAGLSVLREAAPPEMLAVLRECLEKDPSDRPASAQQVAERLRSLGSQDRDPLIGGTDPRPSIAVLPFANRSADPDQGYFCDGMAEEIIGALARMEGLRVVARTSSFAFRGRDLDVREIADRLGVGSILEGSVRKAGRRLRIGVQMIDARDGSTLWSERYDRQLEDVFDIQDEIAAAVVDRLAVQLLGARVEDLVRQRTVSLEAYQVYLRALHLWNRMTPESFEECLGLFHRAVELDPEFAPAHFGLAVWHLSQSFWGHLHPSKALSLGLPHAERALEIDERCSEAVSLLGTFRAFFERDWRTGGEQLRRAVELGPSGAANQVNWGLWLLLHGRREEAAAVARIALRLDPLAPSNGSWANSWLIHAGDVEEGIAGLRRLILLDPDSWMPHYHLSGALVVLDGDLDEARELAEAAIRTSGGAAIPKVQLALVDRLLGREAEADRRLLEMTSMADEIYVPPSFLAWLHLAAGDESRALAGLRRAAEIHDPWVSLLPLHLPDRLRTSTVEAFIGELGLPR